MCAQTMTCKSGMNAVMRRVIARDHTPNEIQSLVIAELLASWLRMVISVVAVVIVAFTKAVMGLAVVLDIVKVLPVANVAVASALMCAEEASDTFVVRVSTGSVRVGVAITLPNVAVDSSLDVLTGVLRGVRTSIDAGVVEVNKNASANEITALEAAAPCCRAPFDCRPTAASGRAGVAQA